MLRHNDDPGRWPLGLYLILWCSCCAVLVDAGQLAYYFSYSHKVSGECFAGMVAAVLEMITAAAGVAGRRKLFAVAALINAAYSLVAGCWFQVTFIPWIYATIVNGGWFSEFFTLDGWFFTWNSICILTNAAVLWYLSWREFQLRRRFNFER